MGEADPERLRQALQSLVDRHPGLRATFASTPDGPVQRAFVHSQHGLLGVSAGGFTGAAGDTLVLEDSAFVRGRWAYQRLALWRAGAADLRSEGRRSEDGRATWFVTQRTRYQRRAAGAAPRG